MSANEPLSLAGRAPSNDVDVFVPETVGVRSEPWSGVKARFRSP